MTKIEQDLLRHLRDTTILLDALMLHEDWHSIILEESKKCLRKYS